MDRRKMKPTYEELEKENDQLSERYNEMNIWLVEKDKKLAADKARIARLEKRIDGALMILVAFRGE